MSEMHLSPKQLEAFVVGSLDAADTARLEAHVSACADCQACLEREARLELAFAAVATRAMSKPAQQEERSVKRALPAAAFGVFAMAAALAMWITARGGDEARMPTSEEPAAAAAVAPTPEVAGDASTATASLDMQADGSRLGVRD